MNQGVDERLTSLIRQYVKEDDRKSVKQAFVMIYRRAMNQTAEDTMTVLTMVIFLRLSSTHFLVSTEHGNMHNSFLSKIISDLSSVCFHLTLPFYRGKILQRHGL